MTTEYDHWKIFPRMPRKVTNLGNPRNMPRFSDAGDLLARLRSEKFVSRPGLTKFKEKLGEAPDQKFPE